MGNDFCSIISIQNEGLVQLSIQLFFLGLKIEISLQISFTFISYPVIFAFFVLILKNVSQDLATFSLERDNLLPSLLPHLDKNLVHSIMIC